MKERASHPLSFLLFSSSSSLSLSSFSFLLVAERYALNNFRYFVPTPPPGEYTLVLRFAEVSFRHAGRKVFSVVLNREHTVISDLDIYAAVGFGTAHDVHIPFTIEPLAGQGEAEGTVGYLRVNGGAPTAVKHHMPVEFVKTPADNPKVNAIVIVQAQGAAVDAILPLDPLPEKPKKQKHAPAPDVEVRTR